MGKDRSAELATDRREYRRGENVLVRARFTDERLAPAEDDGVSVVLEQQGGKNLRLQLQRAEMGRGVFEASLSDLPEGRYHAWIAAPTFEGGAPATDFLVTVAAGEVERIEADFAELARASDDDQGTQLYPNYGGAIDESTSRRPSGADRSPAADRIVESLAAGAGRCVITGW